MDDKQPSISTATPPAMALGTMYFGTAVDERRSFNLLDRFVELGGEWLDTSNNYSFWTSNDGAGGQSETVLGQWLAANPEAPVRISTKVGADPTRPGGFPHHLEGLSDPVVRSSLDRSLDRLRRERVDLYWAHVEDPRVAVDDLVATFGSLVADGLIDRYGLSNHPSWLAERIRGAAAAARVAEPSAYQQRYSYFQPLTGVAVDGQPMWLGMLSADGLDWLDRNPGVEGWVYTATLRGAYDRSDRAPAAEYRHVGNDRRSRALDVVAADRGLSRGQVALAWLVSGRPALTPIIGVSTQQQLEQCWTGATTSLTSDEMAVLNDAAAAAGPTIDGRPVGSR